MLRVEPRGWLLPGAPAGDTTRYRSVQCFWGSLQVVERRGLVALPWINDFSSSVSDFITTGNGTVTDQCNTSPGSRQERKLFKKYTRKWHMEFESALKLTLHAGERWKLNTSLCLIKQRYEDVWGSGVLSPQILVLGTGMRWVLNSGTGRFNPGKRVSSLAWLGYWVNSMPV